MASGPTASYPTIVDEGGLEPGTLETLRDQVCDGPARPGARDRLRQRSQRALVSHRGDVRAVRSSPPTSAGGSRNGAGPRSTVTDRARPASTESGSTSRTRRSTGPCSTLHASARSRTRAAALREVRRVLRPGATFHVLEHGLAPDADVVTTPAAAGSRSRSALAGGCHLTRDLCRAPRRGQASRSRTASAAYLSGPRFATAVEPTSQPCVPRGLSSRRRQRLLCQAWATFMATIASRVTSMRQGLTR